MYVTVPLVRIAMVALAASFTSPLLTVDAMAAKEKFERTKPHVNVGTIGHVDSNQETDALASPQVESGSASGEVGSDGCRYSGKSATRKPC